MSIKLDPMETSAPKDAIASTQPVADLDLQIDMARKHIASDELSLLQLIELAGPLSAAGRENDVIDLYRQWIRGTRSEHKYIALFNLGVLLGDSGRTAEAIECYRDALRLNPGFAQAAINLGRQLEANGEIDAALGTWREAEQSLQSQGADGLELRLMALNSIGRVAEQVRRYEEAEQALAASLALRPGQSDVIQHWVHLRQKQCEWPVYDASAVPGLIENAMLVNTSPLAMLSAYDDPALQMMASRSFVQRKFSEQPAPIAHGRRYTHRRLRIGYLGGNLCVHAVGLLLADVLEHQDRDRFESFAFCYSPDDGSAYRARLMATFDHVYRVASLNDAQLAQLIAEREIDVLVDLHSLSDGVRAGVLMRRPAPVQVAWLGFIGPSAMPWIDHVIADRYALPEEQLSFYSEKPLYLSRGVLPLCRRAPVAPRSRADIGLPDDKFVFATFNNIYKLNLRTFSSWMRILRDTQDSVLWLLDDNPVATSNLREQAKKQGVDPSRLIFASRVSIGDYLSRFQCADLFLDNHPYNAGSTAADALGCGLPLLTLSGTTFVSRMAGAMLNAAGLPDLIAGSHDEYEQKAISLRQDPQMLVTMRERLNHALDASPSCNPREYMKDLEALFRRAAD